MNIGLGNQHSVNGKYWLFVDHIFEGSTPIYVAGRVLRKIRGYWVPEYYSINMTEKEFRGWYNEEK